MTRREFSGFVGPAYEARSRTQDAQKCINWYPEISAEPGAKSQMVLYPAPGSEVFLDVVTLASVPVGPTRLQYSPASRRELFVVVVGSNLVVLQPNNGSYTVTSMNIATTVGAMSAADNGTTIVIVDGTTNGYTVDIATGATGTIVEPAFYGADTVTFLDGYLVFNRPDTAQFYISGLFDTTFDALAFATKEASPDQLVAVWAEHRELWLIGQYTTEVWYNQTDEVAAADFPFARNNGVFLQHGCAAAASISRLGETFAFLSTDERGSVHVVQANGYQFQRISTPALDHEFSTYETVADAIAFTFRLSGHEFYQLTFPTANKTWVYDITTNIWHERAQVDAMGNFDRHWGNCFANYQGRVLVGHFLNGTVRELLADAYDDAGDTIVRLRRTPHLIADRVQVRYNSVQIEFQPGVGLTSGQGSDPQAMLRWSNDGGFTWSNEHWTTLGKIGKYRTRAKWNRLGVARDRVWEVRVTDPVKAVVIGATIDLEMGIS